MSDFVNSLRAGQQDRYAADQYKSQNKFKQLASQFAAAPPEQQGAIGAQLYGIDPAGAEKLVGFTQQQSDLKDAVAKRTATQTAYKLHAVANAPEGQALQMYQYLAPEDFQKATQAGIITPQTTDEQIRQVAQQHLPAFMAQAGISTAPTYTTLGKDQTLIQNNPMGGPPTAVMTNKAPEVAPVKPEDFSPASVAKYEKSGDKADLVRVYPPSSMFLASNLLQGDALDLAAEKFRVTGQLPAGMGRSPATASKIISRASELATAQGDNSNAVVLKQQANKAGQMALGALTKQQTMVGSFEKTANKNLDLALQLSAKVDRTGVPIINKGIIHFKQNYTGDPDTASFVNALIAARTEYAKVLSGATGATGVTDSARKEADQLFTTASTPQQLQSVIATAKQEMANRMSSFEDQKKELRPDLSGNNPQAQKTQTGATVSTW